MSEVLYSRTGYRLAPSELQHDRMNNVNYTHLLVRALLQLMASIYSLRPSKRAYLKGADGWINFVQGFRTEDGSVRVALKAKDGKLSVLGSIPKTADSVIVFKDRQTIMKAINLPPNELILFLLNSFPFHRCFRLLLLELLPNRE